MSEITPSTIIYTFTDEAPALATYSLLPIVEAFAGAAGDRRRDPRHLARRADPRQLPRAADTASSASATRWPNSASWR